MTGVKYEGIRQLHDLLVNLLSKWLRRAKIPHMGGVGGFKRACNGFFTKFVNQLPDFDPISPAHGAALRFRQSTILDLTIDTQSMDPSEDVAKILGDHILADMKTLAPGVAYSES